jgi:hypothetical protein
MEEEKKSGVEKKVEQRRVKERRGEESGEEGWRGQDKSWGGARKSERKKGKASQKLENIAWGC